MATGGNSPQASGPPGLPAGAALFNLSEFKGMNTQAQRMAIDDQEMFWCENLFPIGPGNLRSLWGLGSSIYTAGGSLTVVYFMFYNLAAVQYCAVFLSDGTAVQVNMSSLVTTPISSTPGTFYNGAGLPYAAQYGDTDLLICNNDNTNGYWIWDGTLLYTSGTLAPPVTVTAGGSGYTTGATAAAGGGSGSGATFTVTVVGGIVTAVTITNPGTGYKAGDTVTLAISAVGAGSGATATISLMPFGVAGTSIEVYTSRAWLTNGPKIQVTDPGSLSAFNTVFTSTDSFLKNFFANLKQANSFLYLIADSSINAINNVNTSGSPPITTFNNQNADPQVGTPWRDSVVAFGRDLVMANTNGIYVLLGGAAEKVSSPMDGVFASATLPLTVGAGAPSAALNTMFGIKVYMLLATVVDAFTGLSVPKLICWDGKKWFIASQEQNLTFINTQEVKSNLQAYGTNGKSIFPLFAQASSILNKKVQSRLTPGESYLLDKQSLGFYAELFDNTDMTVTINYTLDNENGPQGGAQLQFGNIITFVNSIGTIINFTNVSSNEIDFSIAGLGIQGKDAVPMYGKTIGFSFTSVGADFILSNISLLYKAYHFYR